MAPKKRSKSGRSGEGESSSAPNFDRRRFWDATAAENYTKLLEKNMQRERGMDQSCPDCVTLIHARRLGWATFVQPPTDAVMSLVREFYANLKVKHEDYHVRIRGRMVAFDSKTINSIYAMPNYDEDQYTLFLSEPYPYDVIIATLCEPGSVWKLNNQGSPVTFPATSLKRDAYNWYHFVTARLMPSGHVSDVTKHRAALVYCLLTGRTIDAGKVIMSSLLQAARGSSTVSMPHSATITDLCRSAGVTWDAGEQLLQPKGAILLVELLPRERYLREPARRGEASGSRAQSRSQPLPAIQAPPPGDDTIQSVHERLADLERNMRTQWQITREHFAYVHDFHTVLASRFPPASATDAPFPPPPAWSHLPVEDDFQYEDDEVRDADR